LVAKAALCGVCAKKTAAMAAASKAMRGYAAAQKTT
jgi:hypothetical protein